VWERPLPVSFKGEGQVELAKDMAGVYVAQEVEGALRIARYSDGRFEDLGAVGNLAAVSENAAAFSVARADGRMYVAYIDKDHGGHLRVKALSGAREWRDVAQPVISEYPVSFVSLVVSDKGTLFVAYANIVNDDNHVVVKQFSDGRWTAVGDRAYAQKLSGINYFSFCLDGEIPYIAFRNYSLKDMATVKKFNGTSWVFVGNERALPKGRACALRLKVIEHVPFLVYRYDAWKVVVARFLDGKWMYHEPNGIDTRLNDLEDRYPLDFSFIDGTLFVVYRDRVSDQQWYVVSRLDGGDWKYIGVSVAVHGDHPYPFLFVEDALYTVTPDPLNSGLVLRKFDHLDAQLTVHN
jgi:hypothetical protein